MVGVHGCVAAPRVPQACAAWQWFNYCYSQVPCGKRVLRVNFDETAVCLFQGGGRGNVFVSKTGAAAVQKVSLATRRTYVTYVALLCDDPVIQPRLPQILIANQHTVSAAQLAELRASCPPNVRIIRQQSAWVNAPLCAQIVRWLRSALSPPLVDAQVVLLFDACRSHTAVAVFRACTKAAIWPVVVPAKMTWLLQPLDTHALLPFKIHLQKAYQATRLQAPSGKISITDLLPCIYRAIHTVLEGRSWAYAFDHDGFSWSQAGVSDRVASKLELGAHTVSATRPTDVQMKACFPKRATVPSVAIWRPFDAPLAKAAPLVAAATALGTAPPAIAPAPLGAGLRRSARLGMRAVRAAIGPAAPPPLPPAPSHLPRPAASGTSAGRASSSSSSYVVAPSPCPQPVAGVVTRARSRALALAHVPPTAR